MSEKMYPIPFDSLMNWVTSEYAQCGDGRRGKRQNQPGDVLIGKSFVHGLLQCCSPVRTKSY